jgi:SHS family lactate transporter-like MFS transporter
MMCACVCGAAIVPAYIIPRGDSLIASTFFEQVFVGGVWGPIPVHLIELSPPQVRTLFYSFTYQLGNLASAASATIEATIGERYPLPDGPDGESRYNYGKVIGSLLMPGFFSTTNVEQESSSAPFGYTFSCSRF